MQLEIDKVETLKLKFEQEKEDIKELWTADTDKHKREI